MNKDESFIEGLETAFEAVKKLMKMDVVPMVDLFGTFDFETVMEENDIFDILTKLSDVKSKMSECYAIVAYSVDAIGNVEVKHISKPYDEAPPFEDIQRFACSVGKDCYYKIERIYCYS